MFEITTYYTNTDTGINSTTAGGVKGYVHQTAVAQGESIARNSSLGQSGGPTLTAHYTYFARWKPTSYETVSIAKSHGANIVYPVAQAISYTVGIGVDETARGAVPTTYAYSWHTDTGHELQVKERRTTLPAVSDSQHGSGVAATRFEYYDTNGGLIWTADENGRFTRYEYDSLTDRLTTTIQDADAGDGSLAGLNLYFVSGGGGTAPFWPTLPTSGQGASEQTDYQYDALGRVTRTLGPEHLADISGTATNVRTATWTVYLDAAHETWSAQGYATETSPDVWTTYTIVGPISITKMDKDGRVTDQIQATWSGTALNGLTATNCPALDDADLHFTSWTANKYANTRLAFTAVYYAIPTIPAGSTTLRNTDGTFLGSDSANYTKTTIGYENYGVSTNKGRQNMVKSADGTITRYVYDARGNVVETWIGTNDDLWTDADPSGGYSYPDNNMVQVASSTYDADGNLLESRSWFDSGATDYYATTYQYDSRDRVTGTLAANGVAAIYTLDNLGRTTRTDTYANCTYNPATKQIDGTTTTANHRAETRMSYDALGQVYESRTYEVDPSSGAEGHYLPSYAWYDLAGNVIKTETGTTGAFTKYAYDGLGRLTTQYVGYDTSESTTELYAGTHGPLDLDDDTILQQSQTWYDAASEVVASATFQRFPDSTVTGILTAVNSYATASAVWYDGLGRTLEAANYGHEKNTDATHYFFDGSSVLIDANSNGIPDVAEAAPPATNSSDNYIVAQTQYDSAGRAYRAIDNLGRVNETQFDAAGRVVKTIQNYNNGVVAETDTAQDVTLAYEYDSAGRLVTMIAYNAKGSGNGVQSQATKYLYTSTINAAWQTGVIYPDTADTVAGPDANGDWSVTSGADHTSTDYDWLGRVVTTTDQNNTALAANQQRGVTHTYTYVANGTVGAGQVTLDAVTVPAGSTGVDQSVLSIKTTYDDLGRVRNTTSYATANGTGTPVNDVQESYDGWSNLVREWQANDGAVDTGTTPSVQYTFADGADVNGKAAYLRQTGTIYPNGRNVQMGYGTANAVDDIMSRLEMLSDSGGTLATLQYLGLGTIVKETFNQSGVTLNYDPSANNSYGGFDRFGRIIDQKWTNGGGTIDEYTYTFDRSSNVLTKNNATAAALNEVYGYNALNELTSTTRNGSAYQSWNLDGLGNWSSFTNQGTIDNKTFNAVNEQVTSSASVTSVYDAAGNMITTAKAGSPTTGVACKFDAWNRLVSATVGATTVTYQYDGTGRRTQRTVGTAVEHNYYSGQQIVLVYNYSGATFTGGNAYIWSPIYVNTPVLRDTYDSAGNLVAASRLYYTTDANHNITAVTNPSGTVLERYSYSSFGDVTVHNPSWTALGNYTASTVSNTRLFGGMAIETITGLFGTFTR